MAKWSTFQKRTPLLSNATTLSVSKTYNVTGSETSKFPSSLSSQLYQAHHVLALPTNLVLKSYPRHSAKVNKISNNYICLKIHKTKYITKALQ